MKNKLMESPHSWLRHVAIIMDGNGRWARRRGLSRIEGHRAGIKSVQAVVEACRDLGISYLTLYTFSVENWQRPKSEVDELMRLLYYYLTTETSRLHKNATRLVAIGQLERLPKRVYRKLQSIIRETAAYRDLTLVLALSYGGRSEILDAINAIGRERAEGRQPHVPLTPERLAEYLYAPEIPPPDLLIRTSGEMRLSNFLLWKAAHARLYFTPVLWPDFRRNQLEEVIREVRSQEAVSGGVRQ